MSYQRFEKALLITTLAIPTKSSLCMSTGIILLLIVISSDLLIKQLK